MSSLWLYREGRWRAHVVRAGHLLSGDEIGLPGLGLFVPGPGRSAALFVRGGAPVRVNGEPVVGGMRLLEHADELLTPAGRGAFSAQSAPEVSTFEPAPGGRPPTCPVCRGPVRDGAAVQCPGCGRWAHQAEGRPCWTYAPACRFCNHPTSFAAEATWRPDREGDDG